MRYIVLCANSDGEPFALVVDELSEQDARDAATQHPLFDAEDGDTITAVVGVNWIGV